MRSLGQMFVGIFAAKALTLGGVVALGLGLVLVISGIPAAWLAWSGALLSVMALATLLLLGRRLRPRLDRMSEEHLTTIYMPLVNDGTDVWRPVEAMKIARLGYMVTEDAPPDEQWAFQPGHILRCEERHLSGETHLVAVTKAT